MSYKWELTEDSETGEYYFRKLVNMNLPEVLFLKEAADYINKLEYKVKELEKQKKVKEYLSQGFSPTETGMALNMSLDDVLKVKEQK